MTGAVLADLSRATICICCTLNRGTLGAIGHTEPVFLVVAGELGALGTRGTTTTGWTLLEAAEAFVEAMTDAVASTISIFCTWLTVLGRLQTLFARTCGGSRAQVAALTLGTLIVDFAGRWWIAKAVDPRLDKASVEVHTSRPTLSITTGAASTWDRGRLCERVDPDDLELAADVEQ